MKSSTQDQAQGAFHKIAGKIKELFGKASMDAEQKNANTIEFNVALKPDEEKVITYTTYYSW